MTDAFVFSCGPDCHDGFSSTTGTGTYNKVDYSQETVQVSSYITNSKGAECMPACVLELESDPTNVYSNAQFVFTGQSSFTYTCDLAQAAPINLYLRCINYIETEQSDLMIFTCEPPNPDCS